MSLIRVVDHAGRQLLDNTICTQTESVFIQQSTIEDALESTAGRVLLRILKAVDYAGAQHRPVMLLGRKQAKGGFMIAVTVPHPEQTRMAPPEVAGNGSPGTNGNGKSSQRGQQFYRG